MKTSSLPLLLTATVLGLFAPGALAHEKTKAGPNGGRILTKADPDAEFFVTPQRKVQLTFLDRQGKPIAPDSQSVTVTTGDRSAPTVLKLVRQGNVLLSDAPLPEGRVMPAVIQIKSAPDAPEIVERFNINLGTCSECRHAEYACICGH